ncbi:MAG: tetratricopeptide repeat protein [Candidatus Schekmanbacteria bacterium]|nr:tetratricopeptide repeat protein [Candidatus Schekmanbacteria bacterium]
MMLWHKVHKAMRSELFCFCLMLLTGILILPSLSFAANESEIEFSKGLLAFDESDFAKAAIHIEKGLEGDPKNMDMLVKLGETYIALKEYEEAADALKKALAISPEKPEILYHLGVAHLNLGEYKEASEELEAAGKALPDNGKIVYYKGVIQFRQENFKEAIPTFEKSIELDKSLEMSSKYYIGASYFKLQKYVDSKPYFQFVIDKSPGTKLAETSAKFIDAADEREKAKKPWSLFGNVSWEYDNNVTLQPSDSISGVKISGKGDWRGVFYLGGEYKVVNTDEFQVSGRYSFYQSIYRQLRHYNITGNQVAANFSYKPVQPLRLNLLYSFNHYDLEWTRYLDSHSIIPGFTFTFSKNSIIQGYFRYQNKDYLQDQGNISFNRDAQNFAWGLSQYLFFMDNNGYINLSYSMDKDNARGSDWDYNGNTIGASFLVPLPYKMKGEGSFQYERKIYEHINSIFNQRRRDKEYDWSVGLIKELNKNFSVSVKFNKIRDDSSLELYDYDREITSFNFTARF